ncbi:MAG TPA: beta-propeller fold lactonase family protein [Candidatus Sulfotelmatobacter sp.]|nr:beta-propeller fold lactonase family protein [Candidatus Sulfotelmatobacter sp.]
MSNRFAWLLGVVVLVTIGLLVACGTTYNSSTDGLVLLTSQGSGLLETFSFSLNKGSVSAVNNPPADTSNLTCVLNGIPSALVVDPAGAYAYSIVTANMSECGTGSTTTGIAVFKVNSSGTMTAVGQLITLQKANVGVCQTIQGITQPVQELVSVVPVALAMDSAGKFLFVSDAATTDMAGLPAPGAVSVFAIGSGGSLQEVTSTDPATSSPFTVPPSCTGQANNFVALALTPTVFPGPINGTQPAVCTSTPPPTSEYLYAVDQANYIVWEFAVNTSTGALANPGSATMISSFPTDAVPAGVAADPCNRFVYVSGNLNGKVSAYTICNGSTTQSPSCTLSPIAPGGLVPVTGSPFSLSGSSTGPGPLVVDPYGNTLYVLDTLSNQISILRISPVSGSLTPGNPATVATGAGPISIAIRSDDNWLFVTNFQSATLSEYQVTPATGSLQPLPATQTDNQPWGLAVK